MDVIPDIFTAKRPDDCRFDFCEFVSKTFVPISVEDWIGASRRHSNLF